MDLHPLVRAGLRPENGLLAQRLIPWPTLNAPFEGAWCVIRPGTASIAHAHHEYEIFIAVSGAALVESEGEQTPFVGGDIVYFKPGADHRVINNGDSDFQMYGVWWDTEIAHGFLVRDGLDQHGRDQQGASA